MQTDNILCNHENILYISIYIYIYIYTYILMHTHNYYIYRQTEKDIYILIDI